MKYIEKRTSPVRQELFRPELLPAPDGREGRAVFFDIETTGLSTASAAVYLIGAMTREDDGWLLRQWFSEGLSDERRVIEEFFSFLGPSDVLVHFNGEGFDLPFLTHAASQYRIPCPLNGLLSCDLYRSVRPFRRLLGTDHMNQKSMERYLGIFREDPFNGGELISVYEAWLVSPGDTALSSLLLHNEEDILAMPALTSLLSYPAFLDGPKELLEAGPEGDAFVIRCACRERLPHAFRTVRTAFAAEGSDSLLEIRIPLIRGSAAHYFANYRDYYYLPFEGRAIHKSLAEFVDRAAKKKATARTACVRTSDCFVPWTGPLPEGAYDFYREFRDASPLIRLSDLGEEHPERTELLLGSILRELGQGKAEGQKTADAKSRPGRRRTRG